ncbi:MAG: zinc ribbon domain-containing protein [Treponema sp.]|nr:zinc ribbon domain-containing protein [Treponema sp.]
MNTNFLNIVKRIVAEKGEDVLSNPKLVSAMLADLARDIPKPAKYAFLRSLENDCAQKLKNAGRANSADAVEKLARQLNRDEGLDAALCTEVLRLLAAVLFGETKTAKNVYCKNCGKELPKEWLACPYCGTQTAGHGTVSRPVYKEEKPRPEPVPIPVSQNADDNTDMDEAEASREKAVGCGIFIIMMIIIVIAAIASSG